MRNCLSFVPILISFQYCIGNIVKTVPTAYYFYISLNRWCFFGRVWTYQDFVFNNHIIHHSMRNLLSVVPMSVAFQYCIGNIVKRLSFMCSITRVRARVRLSILDRDCMYQDSIYNQHIIHRSMRERLSFVPISAAFQYCIGNIIKTVPTACSICVFF